MAEETFEEKRRRIKKELDAQQERERIREEAYKPHGFVPKPTKEGQEHDIYKKPLKK